MSTLLFTEIHSTIHFKKTIREPQMMKDAFKYFLAQSKVGGIGQMTLNHTYHNLQYIIPEPAIIPQITMKSGFPFCARADTGPETRRKYCTNFDNALTPLYFLTLLKFLKVDSSGVENWTTLFLVQLEIS